MLVDHVGLTKSIEGLDLVKLDAQHNPKITNVSFMKNLK